MKREEVLCVGRCYSLRPARMLSASSNGSPIAKCTKSLNTMTHIHLHASPLAVWIQLYHEQGKIWNTCQGHHRSHILTVVLSDRKSWGKCNKNSIWPFLKFFTILEHFQPSNVLTDCCARPRCWSSCTEYCPQQRADRKSAAHTHGSCIQARTIMFNNSEADPKAKSPQPKHVLLYFLMCVGLQSCTCILPLNCEDIITIIYVNILPC